MGLCLPETGSRKLTWNSEPVPKKLESESAHKTEMEKVSFINNESSFRWELFDDQMAFDKLHDGIRGFAKDGAALKDMLKEKLAK